jgi:hypothetical protein
VADRARRRDWGTALALFVPLESRAEEPIIPLSLFGSRTFASEALLKFFVGIGMFGVILYTPLFVHGVLGQSATNSGTVLTPIVFAINHGLMLLTMAALVVTRLRGRGEKRAAGTR